MKTKQLMSLLFLFSLTTSLYSCKSKEYTGNPLKELTYQTVDFMGGFTKTYIYNFEENVYSKENFIPWTNETIKESKSFSEEEEKTFIDGCYQGGLYSIKSKYVQENVCDGGGWYLTIKYENGKIKHSYGENKSPEKIFNKCSIYFYKLSGEEVMGNLPKNYQK